MNAVRLSAQAHARSCWAMASIAAVCGAGEAKPPPPPQEQQQETDAGAGAGAGAGAAGEAASELAASSVAVGSTVRVATAAGAGSDGDEDDEEEDFVPPSQRLVVPGDVVDVSDAGMEELYYIGTSGQKLTRITGLEHLVQLQTLSFRSNFLRKLEGVSTMTRLPVGAKSVALRQ